MSADKGVHRAVRVARRAGWPLVILARIGEPAERAYFDQQVRPLLGPDDDTLAEQPLAVRVDLMGHAARDEIQSQLDALTAGHEADDELARMKAQLPASGAAAAIEGTQTAAADQPSPPATS